jgi:hypothetical protein
MLVKILNVGMSASDLFMAEHTSILTTVKHGEDQFMVFA